MKYLVGVGLLLLGGLIGYLTGVNTCKESDVSATPITEVITETIHDTIIQKETINISVDSPPVDSSVIKVDTLGVNVDSLARDNFEDTLNDNLSISTEVLENSIWLDIEVIQDFEEKDSLIKDLMGISDVMPTTIIVEFWRSPLNFSGYKLSRSKLVIYGMPPHLEYRLYRKKSNYYLSTEDVYYALKETEEFSSYVEVPKETVFND